MSSWAGCDSNKIERKISGILFERSAIVQYGSWEIPVGKKTVPLRSFITIWTKFHLRWRSKRYFFCILHSSAIAMLRLRPNETICDWFDLNFVFYIAISSVDFCCKFIIICAVFRQLIEANNMINTRIMRYENCLRRIQSNLFTHMMCCGLVYELKRVYLLVSTEAQDKQIDEKSQENK